MSENTNTSSTMRLIRATKEFQTDLSDEHNQELQNAGLPDLADVMRVIAQFDRALLMHGLQQRFGPRLTRFLEITQQFASTGHVLVAGPDTMPTSNVWHLVKLSLLAAAQHATNIDKFSMLIGEFGSFIPDSLNIYNFLSQSDRLPECFIEYQLLVVKFCHQMYSWCKASSLDWTSAVRVMLVESCRSQLKIQGSLITNEIVSQTATVAYADDQRTLSQRLYRSNASGPRFVSDTAQLRASLANMCGDHNYRRAWKQIRKLGRSKWFEQTAQYREWKMAASSSTLVYNGHTGIGKSVLLANIVDDLFIEADKLNTTVAYFFCQYNVSESMETISIIGSLIYQIVAGAALDHEELRSISNRSRPDAVLFNIEEMCSIAQLALGKGHKIIFILDGIEECSIQVREEVLSRLKQLQDVGNLSLCIASQSMLATGSGLFAAKLTSTVNVALQEQNTDIADFLEMELETMTRDGRLFTDNQDLISRIKDTLVKRSAGNFLWATLQLVLLRFMYSDNMIRDFIDNLPRNVSESYARLIQIADISTNKDALLLLRLVLGAKRPLSTVELSQVISINPGDSYCDISEALTTPLLALMTDKGLVNIDEEDTTVTFLHSSMAQFLIEHEDLAMDREACSSSLLIRILTLFNSSFSEKRTIIATSPRMAIPDIPLGIIQAELVSLLPWIAKIMLSYRRGRNTVLPSLPSVEIRHNKWLKGFDLYARLYWCSHLVDIQSPNGMVTLQLRKGLRSHQLEKFAGYGSQNPLVVTIINNRVGLLKLFVTSGKFSSVQRNEALLVAEVGGRNEILEVMIESEYFETTWHTYQIAFVDALLSAVAVNLPNKELDKIIEKAPKLLEAFALNLQHESAWNPNIEVARFTLRYVDEIAMDLQQRWPSHQGEGSLTRAGGVPWQQRIGVLGSRMTDFTPKVDLLESHHPDSTILEPSDISISDVQSRINTDITQTTQITQATTTVQHPDSRLLRVAMVGARKTFEPAPAQSKVTKRSTGYDEVVSFDFDLVLSSSAYAWLVARLRDSSLLSTPVPDSFATARQTLRYDTSTIYKTSNEITEPVQHTAVLIVDWDLTSFLHSYHFAEEPDPEQILNGFLTLSSDGQYVQALTCQQYLQQTWPRSTDVLLPLIIKLIGTKYNKIIVPGGKVEGFNEGKQLHLIVTGFEHLIDDVVKQITWMGSCMRGSPSKDNLYQCFAIVADKELLDASFRGPIESTDIKRYNITYTLKPTVSTSSIGSCWQKLFQYPVIATGFPILRRELPMPGLEINLGTMLALVNSEHLSKFADNLIIKGFSSMFTLSRRHSNLCLWHLSNNDDGSFISYAQITNAGSFPDLGLHEVTQDRHFVGWCKKSSYGAGSLDSNYQIGYSHENPVPSTSFFSNKSLLRGQSYLQDAVYIASDKLQPRPNKQAYFLKDITHLHKSFIVLWDTAEQKGWLTNGTSALLHLVLASINNEKDSIRPPNFQNTDLQVSVRDTERAAASILLNEFNLDLEIHSFGEEREQFRDRIVEIKHILGMIIGHQTIASQRGSLSRERHEGWDFMEVADTSTTLLIPRAWTPNKDCSGWMKFLDDSRTVTLFGRNFGEIFRPVEHDTCKYWAQLPSNNCLLAASIRDVKEIMEKHGNPFKTPKNLTTNTIWWPTASTFNECDCKDSGNHIDVIQALASTDKYCIDSATIEGILHELPHPGAVIFGEVTNRSCVKVTSTSTIPQVPQRRHDDLRPAQSTVPPRLGSSSITAPLSSSDFLVAIICALPKELLAMRLLFDATYDQVSFDRSDTYRYVFGKIGEHNIVAGCLPQGEYGNSSAADIGSQMKRSFKHVKFWLLVGIGGGIPSSEHDIRLGDVVISVARNGYPGVIKYDFYKTVQDEVSQPLGSSHRPPEELTSIMSEIESDPNLLNPLQAYIQTIVRRKAEYRSPGAQCDRLYKSSYKHVKGQRACNRCTGPIVRRLVRRSAQPVIHYGLIASGDQVMKDATARDQLGKRYGALCFEMEAGGLTNRLQCVVIRGICDYSDSHKHSVWQNYACASAASYAKLLLIRLRDLTSD